MKKRLVSYVSATFMAPLICVAIVSAAGAQSQDFSLQEDTFVRVPALEFTIVSIGLDKYLTSVPLDFGQTERAFSQIRPGLNYDQGMVWLTFKSGGKKGLLSHIQDFRITKKVKSSLRLSSTPRWLVRKKAPLRRYTFAAGTTAVPAPAPKPQHVDHIETHPAG